MSTIAEKILSRAVGHSVSADDIISARVDRAMSHDNAALVWKNFKSLGVDKVWDSEKIVIPIDHRVPANNIKVAEGQKTIREMVKLQQIKYFYGINTGICHQIMPEKGHVRPGWLIVGTDSHTTTYGAFGAFSTGIGATEMAGVWATGELWLRVPNTIKINVSGALPKGVYPKDVILHIIGDISAEGANYRAVEFYGDTMENMSISGRMTVSNMSMEMGAKAAIIPPDKKTFDWLRPRVDGEVEGVYADADAVYEREIEYDVSALEPQVARPHTVDNVSPVSDVAGKHLDQVFIGSCTNGRTEDFEVVARILEGKKIHPDVRLIVGPASYEVYLESIEKGYIQTMIKAGAVIINPGCGPCLGAHEGIMASGERGLSTTNRNFRGRMGSPESELFLASPATAAASAITGEITDPRGWL